MTKWGTTTKFADRADVAARYEGGEIPEDRGPWVDQTISDVESDLMGQVPSLRKSLAEINADSEAAGDPGRLGRVGSLVSRKVLDLYGEATVKLSNPDGAASKSQAMGNMSHSTTWASQGEGSGSSKGKPADGSVFFTEAELDSVRLQGSGAPSQFGTVQVAPWLVGG